MTYKDIIQFWFEEIDQKSWWSKDENFDSLIRERFTKIHQQASRCELDSWRETAKGRLAEIIVLDQFSRNMFRDQPQAFQQDALALALSQEAVRSGADQELDLQFRHFLYMPYMHSESALIHEEAVGLFQGEGMEKMLDFELRHKKIIDKFGRYPHRNEILGRTSTDEEIKFLKQPGSSF